MTSRLASSLARVSLPYSLILRHSVVFPNLKFGHGYSTLKLRPIPSPVVGGVPTTEADSRWKWGLLLCAVATCFYQCNKLLNEDEAKRKHLTQVRNHLCRGYMSEQREKDIPGLELGKRAANNIFSIPGVLMLLEGPSGCGKTTAVQSVLDGRCVVYFSARQHQEQLWLSLANCFGVTDLPKDFHDQIPQLLEQALTEFKQGTRERDIKFAFPLLVIDDVQLLIAAQSGNTIFAWCLELASKGLMSVLYVASEPVAVRLKAKSGYRSRLLVSQFEQIENSVLEAALVKISAPNMVFTPSEAADIVSVIGTHMADLRRIHRLAASSTKSQALQQAIAFEQRQIHTYLQTLTPRDKYDVARLFVLEKLASTQLHKPVPLSELRKHCYKTDSSLDYSVVNTVIDKLAQENIVVRSWSNEGEIAAFSRPMQHHAFKLLINNKNNDYMEIRKAITQ